MFRYLNFGHSKKQEKPSQPATCSLGLNPVVAVGEAKQPPFAAGEVTRLGDVTAKL